MSFKFSFVACVLCPGSWVPFSVCSRAYIIIHYTCVCTLNIHIKPTNAKLICRHKKVSVWDVIPSGYCRLSLLCHLLVFPVLFVPFARLSKVALKNSPFGDCNPPPLKSDKLVGTMQIQSNSSRPKLFRNKHGVFPRAFQWLAGGKRQEFKHCSSVLPLMFWLHGLYFMKNLPAWDTQCPSKSSTCPKTQR